MTDKIPLFLVPE